MPWRPKPLRPIEPPSVEEMERLRRVLHADRFLGDDTKGLLLRLCRSEPADRFRMAMDQVLRMMHKETSRTNELSRLLTGEEFKAYSQVASSRMRADDKHTVERLLCLEDRHIMSSFLRNAFNHLRAFTPNKLS